MAIDFYAILLEEYGPANSPFKMKNGEMAHLVEELRTAMIRYLAQRVGPDHRIGEVMGHNRRTIQKKRDKAGIPNVIVTRRMERIGSVRQHGVILGVVPGRHDQAAFGVI